MMLTGCPVSPAYALRGEALLEATSGLEELETALGAESWDVTWTFRPSHPDIGPSTYMREIQRLLQDPGVRADVLTGLGVDASQVAEVQIASHNEAYSRENGASPDFYWYVWKVTFVLPGGAQVPVAFKMSAVEDDRMMATILEDNRRAYHRWNAVPGLKVPRLLASGRGILGMFHIVEFVPAAHDVRDGVLLAAEAIRLWQASADRPDERFLPMTLELGDVHFFRTADGATDLRFLEFDTLSTLPTAAAVVQHLARSSLIAPDELARGAIQALGDDASEFLGAGLEEPSAPRDVAKDVVFNELVLLRAFRRDLNPGRRALNEALVREAIAVEDAAVAPERMTRGVKTVQRLLRMPSATLEHKVAALQRRQQQAAARGAAVRPMTPTAIVRMPLPVPAIRRPAPARLAPSVPAPQPPVRPSSPRLAERRWAYAAMLVLGLIMSVGQSPAMQFASKTDANGQPVVKATITVRGESLARVAQRLRIPWPTLLAANPRFRDRWRVHQAGLHRGRRYLLVFRGETIEIPANEVDPRRLAALGLPKATLPAAAPAKVVSPPVTSPDPPETPTPINPALKWALWSLGIAPVAVLARIIGLRRAANGQAQRARIEEASDTTEATRRRFDEQLRPARDALAAAHVAYEGQRKVVQDQEEGVEIARQAAAAVQSGELESVTDDDREAMTREVTRREAALAMARQALARADTDKAAAQQALAYAEHKARWPGVIGALKALRAAPAPKRSGRAVFIGPRAALPMAIPLAYLGYRVGVLVSDEAEARWVETLFADVAVPGGRYVVIVHPGDEQIARQMMARRFSVAVEQVKEFPHVSGWTLQFAAMREFLEAEKVWVPSWDLAQGAAIAIHHYLSGQV